jgi:protein-tyrosine phosphatase
VPRDGLAYRSTLVALLDRVRAGARLAIACRGGLDRSGMTAACLLREGGMDADLAIARVHEARQHTLTMPPQVRYVRGWPPSR